MFSIQDVRAKHQWRWYLEKRLTQWEIHKLWERELKTITHKCKHDVDRIAGTSRTQHQDSKPSCEPGLPSPMSYPPTRWIALPDAHRHITAPKLNLHLPYSKNWCLFLQFSSWWIPSWSIQIVQSETSLSPEPKFQVNRSYTFAFPEYISFLSHSTTLSYIFISYQGITNSGSKMIV